MSGSFLQKQVLHRSVHTVRASWFPETGIHFCHRERKLGVISKSFSCKSLCSSYVCSCRHLAGGARLLRDATQIPVLRCDESSAYFTHALCLAFGLLFAAFLDVTHVVV